MSDLYPDVSAEIRMGADGAVALDKNGAAGVIKHDRLRLGHGGDDGSTRELRDCSDGQVRVMTIGSAVGGNRTRYPKLTIATCVLASGLPFIDASVVNVALPAIETGLKGDAASLQWVLEGYLLPLSALILYGGALGDRYGRRILMLCGILLFGFASVACALAMSMSSLILARFIQGMGAAILMPNSLAILGIAFDGEERGRAVGIWAAAGAAAMAVGPILGGWLIDVCSWRLIFAINIPVAIVGFVFAFRFINRDENLSNARSDSIGALLVIVGLGALIWGIIDGARASRWDADAMVGCCVGLVFLLSFIFWEHKQGAKAMLPLALFGSKSSIALTVLTLFMYGALGSVTVVIPFTLIKYYQYQALGAGAALLPIPLIVALTSPLFGKWAGRAGARPLLVAGPILMAAGCLLSLRLSAAGQFWSDILPAIFVFSIGLACAVAPLTMAVLEAAGPAYAGAASGLNNAIARTGGLIATALLGGVLASKGPSMMGAFQTAMTIAAAVCLSASGCALFVGKGKPPSRPDEKTA